MPVFWPRVAIRTRDAHSAAPCYVERTWTRIGIFIAIFVARPAIGNPLHSDLHTKLCCHPFYTFCLNPCKIKRAAIRIRNDQRTTQTKTFFVVRVYWIRPQVWCHVFQIHPVCRSYIVIFWVFTGLSLKENKSPIFIPDLLSPPPLSTLPTFSSLY
jgi:hypothetical protein